MVAAQAASLCEEHQITARFVLCWLLGCSAPAIPARNAGCRAILETPTPRGIAAAVVRRSVLFPWPSLLALL